MKNFRQKLILRGGLYPLAFWAFLAGLLVLNLLFYARLPEYAPWWYIPFGTACDLTLPVLFCLLAVFLKSRIAVVFSVLAMLLILLVKTFNLILFSRTYEVLTHSTVRTLALHTDDFSLRIQLGESYRFQFGFLFLGILALFFGLSFFGCRFVRRRQPPRTENAFRLSLLVLMLAAIGSNLYYSDHEEELGKTYFKREYMIRPATRYWYDYRCDRARFERNETRFGAGPVPAFYANRIRPDSADWFAEKGVELPMRAEEGGAVIRDFRRIILVCVESLDLAFLHKYNSEIPADCTAFLDRAANEYVSFDNFFTGAQPTSWGLDAVLSSRFEYEQDLHVQNAPSLFSILGDQGYKSFLFVPVNQAFSDIGRGYRKLFRPDHAYFLEEINREFGFVGKYYWGIGDDELYESFFRALDTHKPERFVALLSTMDLHHPYTATGPGALGPDEMPGRFYRALRGTDRNLEQLVNRIQKSDWYDDATLIVITADHSATHGDNVTKRAAYDPDRIPLILITRNNHLKGIFDTTKFASQVDFAPTLLDLLGLPKPESFIGRSFLRKGNFAWSKSPSSLLLFRPEKPDYIYNFEGGPPKSRYERALFEFYDTYYNVSEPESPADD